MNGAQETFKLLRYCQSISELTEIYYYYKMQMNSNDYTEEQYQSKRFRALRFLWGKRRLPRKLLLQHNLT